MTKDFFYSSFWSSEIIELDEERNMSKNRVAFGNKFLFARAVRSSICFKAEDISDE